MTVGCTHMAYDKEKIEKQLLSNIQKDEDITTFEDAALTVAPALRTLYDWELHELHDIKSSIDANKIKVKNKLRKQWKKDSASPTLQLALYKLLSNEGELRALSMEKREHSGGIELKKIERTIVDPKDE